LLNEVDPPATAERLKGAEMLNITAPAPSRYVSHQLVEDVATQCNLVYRKYSGVKKGYPGNNEKLVDVLQIHLSWEVVDEPEDAIFFACYSQHGSEGEITINKKHRKFFESRPEIYNSTLGHEIGHCILNHHSFGSSEGTPSLFPDFQESS